MDQFPISVNSREDLSAKKIFDAFPNRATKKFGQNFLFDGKINRKIVTVAGNLAGKVVAEVGPGPGGLTLEILKQDVEKLYLIEMDRHWCEVWRNLAPLFNGKLEIIECDALRFDLKTISPNVIISNLPYNISTQLLCKWLREFDLYETLVLMFQKEVADRLYAVPSTKSYGRLSVLTQWKSSVSRAFDLESGSFFPPPKVRSTVVKFVPHHVRGMQDNFDLLSDLLNRAFAQRRKTVIKALAEFPGDTGQILSQLGYGKNVRAEQITVDHYIKILERISPPFHK